MNALAKELKATDTRAVNPTGGDQPGMSTSAFDMALIYQAAMRMPEFADAIGASKVTITPQGNRKSPLSRYSDARTFLAEYKGATGAKYSVTNAAKSTFVGSAERDGKRLIVSIMRSANEPTDMAESLLTYGFDLIKAKTELVGNLGATAPPVTSRESSPGATDNQDEDNPKLAANTLAHTAFGNFGLPITIAAGLVVLVGLLMTIRRKMARARRVRTQQAR
jgi:D-alanyl-D-alanine carboxypeptidase (penicillin-binding protein 5/6)